MNFSKLLSEIRLKISVALILILIALMSLFYIFQTFHSYFSQLENQYAVEFTFFGTIFTVSLITLYILSRKPSSTESSKDSIKDDLSDINIFDIYENVTKLPAKFIFGFANGLMRSRSKPIFKSDWT